MTKLISTIQDLQDKISGMDPISSGIFNQFLPEEEIAKKILLTRNPKLDLSSATSIINGVDVPNLGGIQPSVLDNLSGLTQSLPTISLTQSFSQFDVPALPGTIQPSGENIRNAITKLQDGLPNANTNPPKLDWPGKKNLIDEAKKVKNEVKVGVFMLIKEQKELLQDLTFFFIQLSNSVAGAAVLISPLSFNVPAALSLLMNLFDLIRKLISKFMNILMHLEPIKKLQLVLPDNVLPTVTTTIELALKIFSVIFGAISSLQSLLSAVSEEMVNQASPSNTTSQQKSLEDQIKQKEEELIELIRTNASLDDQNKKRDEIKELKDRLARMRQNPVLPPLNPDLDGLRQIIEKVDVNSNFKGKISNISESLEPVRNLGENLQNFVYDVYFPDGTIKQNLTEEDIEYLKGKYDLQFEPSGGPTIP